MMDDANPDVDLPPVSLSDDEDEVMIDNNINNSHDHHTINGITKPSTTTAAKPTSSSAAPSSPSISETSNFKPRAVQKYEKNYRKRLLAAYQVIEKQEGVSVSELLCGNVNIKINDDDKCGSDSGSIIAENGSGSTSDEITRILCVLNVGSSTVAGDVDIIEGWVKDVDGYQEMRLAKGKPLSYLIFSTPEAAAEGLKLVHNRVIPGTGRIVLAQHARWMTFAEITALMDPEQVMKAIPGLFFMTDFISEEEEKELMRNVEQHEWIGLSYRRVTPSLHHYQSGPTKSSPE
ncbi:hypothetical protein HDU76_001954 [Blyttiomyces sp. JEL0837]|nr:hypothetical protein HDU76_001954 [Blyttiomyces sp. JEL0837]